MSFAEHISFFLGKRSALLEDAQNPKLLQAKDQLETKVGGNLGDSTAKKTSFEAIEFALDTIPLEYLESNKESFSLINETVQASSLSESIKGNFIGVDLDSDMDSPALYLMQFKSAKV